MQVAREMAAKLAVIFKHLVKEDNFSAYWKLADFVPVAKKTSSSNLGKYRAISITPLLSKVSKKILDRKLSHYLKSNSLLYSSQFFFFFL